MNEKENKKLDFGVEYEVTIKSVEPSNQKEDYFVVRISDNNGPIDAGIKSELLTDYNLPNYKRNEDGKALIKKHLNGAKVGDKIKVIFTYNAPYVNCSIVRPSALSLFNAPTQKPATAEKVTFDWD